jgi:hypothetical protein
MEKDKSYENAMKVIKTIGPEQRSIQWKLIKHNSIGASEAELAIGGEGYGKTRKTLIDKKVASLPEYFSSPATEFGTKYEIVAKIIIQKLYKKCKVYDSVYIIHPEYYFIGASPDLIIVDEKREKAVLCEIKVPYSRVVDGSINPEYYTQLQWQMETCGIEENIFFDVNLKEYRTLPQIKKLGAVKYCGITIKSPIKPHKDAVPTDLPSFWVVVVDSIEELDQFEDLEKEYKAKELQTKKKTGENHIHQTFHYFVVPNYSSTKVMRDRSWFEKVLPIVKNTWDEVEYRRENLDDMEEYEIYAIDYMPKP